MMGSRLQIDRLGPLWWCREYFRKSVGGQRVGNRSLAKAQATHAPSTWEVP
jgi:hypothetical protein